MVPDDVVTLCREGNAVAFRALYHRTASRVHAWVFRLLGPDAEVADVVQEVYVQVHRSIRNFRGESAFGTWLHRLTLNVACSHLRGMKRRVPVQVGRQTLDGFGSDEVNAIASGLSEESHLAARDQLRRLYAALDQLSSDKRIAFTLYELEGLSLQEISQVVGSGIPTVAARLRRARQELAEAFASAFADGESVRTRQEA